MEKEKMYDCDACPTCNAKLTEDQWFYLHANETLFCSDECALDNHLTYCTGC